MLILGIETSCDETGAAVVKDGTTLICNIVASSQAIHAKYGGIIPEKAAREQVKVIIPVIKEALREAKIKNPQTEIDALAVTVGPGLIGSLLVGVETAKTLAFVWNKPLIPVNHLVGHIYANWLEVSGPGQNGLPQFPALVLLVSGGHTELILMTGHGQFKYLGGTRDDAAGECFDKGARLLNLGYPGGPAISAAAENFPIQNSKFKIKLPRPMINDKSFDFSFSGLKTALSVCILRTKHQPQKTNDANSLAHELQEAVTDVLVSKTLKAAEKYSVKNILLAGGVAANKRLREKFQIPNSKFKIRVPEFELCTDNAAYIASAAYFNYQPLPWEKVQADPSLTI
jgi:N6-L-threonylcarbamoyladenine synthase